MKRKIIWLLIFVLLPIHYISLEKSRITKPAVREEKIFLPEPFLKIFAGEFKGIMADFLVINLSSYYGGIIIEKKEAIEKEFEYMYRVLKSASTLDPYYFDTYYFAQSILAWDGRMPDKAIEILKIGAERRENDWLIPYWIGFNYYYFLRDRKNASLYLKQASLRPGASDLVASMSIIADYEGGETEMAILFLEDMIKRTDDEHKRNKFMIRLDALKKIRFLEQAVEIYRRKFGALPKDISQLVEKNIIDKIPKDPYGGKFYIDEEGKVRTTSNLRFVRKNK
ncbi:MAG: hypothetical protein N2202_09160 [Proteobacteria bacterium]|nr:hypothetical protein [Pseudomonadota bacterium]